MNHLGMKTSSNVIEFYPKYVYAKWPIGSIYIQFPGEAEPADILGGTWQNVSAQYAGMFFRTTDDAFFRAEGGDAEDFGGSDQTSNTHVNAIFCLNSTGNHTHTYHYVPISSSNCCKTTGSSINSLCHPTSYTVSSCIWSHSHSTSWTSMSHNAAETRPTNYTVRIWEKTS